MNENRRTVVWQGWKLSLPKRWDPVKLEGDHAQGYALFADTLRPRLGLRWQTPKSKKLEPADAVFSAMKNEVGQLAADEAKPMTAADENWISPLLYIEPQPPGRDLYSVFSNTSGRLLQVAYHAHRRENVLAHSILPTLMDLPTQYAVPWSIFDLTCVIPGGMRLKSHRLNAGDLGLTFADRLMEITVRQIAVAQLALRRQSLDRWIADQQKTTGRYYRPTGRFGDITVGHLHGRISTMIRRRRYWLMQNQPREVTTMALHDPLRDRLVILEGRDESLLRVVGQSVGTPALF